MMKKLTFLFLCLLASIGLASAQNTQVTGVVISADDGAPVIGASVMVKGTTIGTVTDVDGNFSLSVPANATTLQISFIGMATQELPVQANMRVLLASDTQALEEVIVTAYGTTTKGAFTGSASVVKSEKIEARQVSNVSNALAGAVAGVQVQSSNGQPGTSARIRIRGVGSINAGMDPLYVIDGMPYDGDLSAINPQDIESMTVLKDAASTALYGARGANGIIIVTTKKGKTGKATVNFDAKIGTNSRAIKNYDVMESPQMYLEKTYEAIYNGARTNLGYDAAKANAYANGVLPTKENGGLGYQIYTLPEGEGIIGMDGKLNPNAKLGYSDGEYYYTPDNWANETFQNQMRQEYNVSISASTDKLNYYASLGYLSDYGIIANSGFERYAGRLKADYNVTDWLKVGGNFGYTYADSRYPGEQLNVSSSGNAFFIANNVAPVYPIYVRDAKGNIMQNAGRPIYDYGDGISTNSSRPFMPIGNPAGDLTYNKEMYLMDIMNLSWFAELTPVTGLTLTARYGLHVDNTRFNSLGNALYGQSAAYGGTTYQQHSRLYGFNQQYVANYQFDLNDIHNIDITAGYDGYSYERTNVDATRYGLYDVDSYYVSNGIDNHRAYGAKTAYATEGYIGRVNYNYSETYFGSLSYRRDASSRFHKDNRWGNFYSASAAWMISNEAFMENVGWVDMLKLKASYGEQGNDDLGNFYPYLDQYRITGANGIFADGTLYYKGNPDITWENSKSYNVGVDFDLFNNSLTGTIEYFGRESSDMLYNKPVSPSVGYSSIPMNIGSMRNTGLELDLNYLILENRNLSWDVNLNATFMKNKILKLHPDLQGQMIDGTRIYEEGESMYRMYLVKYAGVDPETGLAQYWAEKDGAPIKTDDWSVASNHKEATDDLLPAVYGGFGTSLKAYGFDFAVQFSYQMGGKIYDSGYAGMMHGGSSSDAGQNWHLDILNSWNENNRNTDVPRVNTQDRYTSSQSDRWMICSNYLSLNNISLGYSLPNSIIRKMSLSKLRVYVAADNVALFTARKGLDPRQSYTSATTSLYTPIRTVSGGISVTF